MQKIPFKIFTSKNKNSKNVVYIDLLKYLKPPKYLKIGIYSNREKAYQDYLKTKFQSSSLDFLSELLSIYNLSVLKGVLTLESLEKAHWAVEGFKKFIIFISPTLGQVTGQKVNLDKPFGASPKIVFENH